MSLRTTITATPEADATAVSFHNGRGIVQMDSHDTSLLLVFDGEHHLAEWIGSVSRQFADALKAAVS